MSTEARPAASPWVPRLAALVVGLGVVALLALFFWGLGNRAGVGQVAAATRPAPDISLTLFALGFAVVFVILGLNLFPQRLYYDLLR